MRVLNALEEQSVLRDELRSSCMSGNEAACLQCANANCTPAFEKCAGIKLKDTPDTPDQICDKTGGEWTDGKCICEPGKVWDADKGCVEGELDPQEKLCIETKGQWKDGKCDCGEGMMWDPTDGCSDAGPDAGMKNSARKPVVSGTMESAYALLGQSGIPKLAARMKYQIGGEDLRRQWRSVGQRNM